MCVYWEVEEIISPTDIFIDSLSKINCFFKCSLGVVDAVIPSFTQKIDDSACKSVSTLKTAFIPSKVVKIGLIKIVLLLLLQ